MNPEKYPGKNFVHHVTNYSKKEFANRFDTRNNQMKIELMFREFRKLKFWAIEIGRLQENCNYFCFIQNVKSETERVKIIIELMHKNN